MARGRARAGGLLAVLVPALAGCGGIAGSERTALMTAARRTLDAAQQGNAPALCASLAPSARARLAGEARGTGPATCVAVLRGRVADLGGAAAFDAALDRGADAHVNVTASGGRGLVQYAPSHGRDFEVPLLRGAGDRWLAMGIIECGTRGCASSAGG
jgi:hypothetical protein